MTTNVTLYQRLSPVGITSYYLPRIFFLAGLEKTLFLNFNEYAFFGQAAVWGLTISQIFQYFFNHRDDPRRLKIFTAIVWLTNSAHQAFATFIVIKLFMNGTLTSKYDMTTLLLFNFAFFFLALVLILAQSFYIYQIWIFASTIKFFKKLRPFIPITLAPFVLFQLVLPSVMFHNTSAFAGIDFYKPTVGVLNRFRAQQNLFLVTLGVNVAINWITFTWLAIYLWKYYFREKLAFEKSTALLWRILFFSVNTGLWSALYSILTLTMFCLLRVGSTYIILHFHCLAPLFTSAILANLNSREYLRPEGGHAFLPHIPRKPPGQPTIHPQLDPMVFQRTIVSALTGTSRTSVDHQNT